MAREEAEEQLHGSELLAAVASGMVALQKQYAGKGPSKCKTYWAGQDTLVIMFGGGYTVAEQTMFEGGRGQEVRDSRSAYQDTMRERMTELVEGIVGRQVVAFMSTSHQAPDLAVELFVFEPREPDHPALARDQSSPAARRAFQ